MHTLTRNTLNQVMFKRTLLGIALAAASAGVSAATDIGEAFATGKAYGDFLLRYETVEEDDPTKEEASGLTLRSRLGYSTAALNGFTATLEVEDSRTVFGKEDYDYAPPARPSGYTARGRSVIADAPHTELDQAFLQYKNDVFTFTGGRQVIALDNHRFIGHVGWRQDRQTFDAVRVDVKPMDKLLVTYAYLSQRNRIFSELADLQVKDHLLNIGLDTSLGKLTAYAYLLEEDNVPETKYDTVGLRFAGKQAASDTLNVLYALEYAEQEYEKGTTEKDADYLLGEIGLEVSGVQVLLGYENLGSDDSTYGFATPLATLHKFNGWNDMFLGTPGVGLVDGYLSVSAMVAGAKVELAYHQYESDDEGTTGIDDLGHEFNISVSKQFGKYYNGGIKYGSYTAGDGNFVDTDKMWVWVGMAF